MLVFMKILHISFLSNLHYHSGIVNQCKYENHVLSSKVDWTSIVYTSCTIDRNIRKYPFKSNNFILRMFYKFYILFSLRNNYDKIIVRYNPLDLMFLVYCCFFRKKTHICLHSYYLDSVKSQFGWLCSVIDNFILKSCIFFTKKIVSVTNEISLLYYQNGLKYYLLPNGIDNSHVPAFDLLANRTHIGFISSSFYPWLGLENLLYQLNSLENFTYDFIIVGHCTSEQIQLINSISSCDIVHIKHLDEINLVEYFYSNCIFTIGNYSNSSFLKYSSALKVRESLKEGIPVLSTLHDIFPNDHLFYMYIEEPSLDMLVEFAGSIDSYNTHDVFNNSSEYISKKSYMESFLYD